MGNADTERKNTCENAEGECTDFGECRYGNDRLNTCACAWRMMIQNGSIYRVCENADCECTAVENADIEMIG